MPVAMVVTDSEWVVNDVGSALTIGGWALKAISDPRSAAEAVRSAEPDVVIVDLQVGSMGGMAIIRAIRAAHGQAPPPRMVLLLDRSADRFIARRARADASVVKPFLASELRVAVSGDTGPAPTERALAGTSEEE